MGEKRRIAAYVFIVLIIAFAVALPWIFGSSCHQASSQGKGNQGKGQSGGGSNLSTESSSLYLSVANLAGNSSVVVVATIGSLATTYNYTIAGRVVFFDVFNLNVLSYVTGSGPAVILFNVGIAAPPLPTPGEKYVLFLKSEAGVTCPPNITSTCIISPTPLDLTYHSTGGLQGRFLVENGLVYSSKMLYPNFDYLRIVVNGVPLSDFVAQVSSSWAAC